MAAALVHRRLDEQQAAAGAVSSESLGLLLLVHSGRLTSELRDARNQAKATAS